MLKFKNSKFKIMQIADVQDTQKTSPDTINLIEKALDSEKPDLVVLTGDQIKGYGYNFRGGDINEKVTTAISNIVSLIDKRNIPFTICFGNHDQQSGVTKKEQLNIYRQFKTCLATDNDDAVKGCANHTLPIYDENGEKVKFAIYLIDSHSNVKVSGYEEVSESQINWYKEKRDEYIKNNDGKVVKSIVFQHIPIHEVFHLLTKVKKSTKGAVQAFRIHKNEWYVLDYNKVNKDGFMGESPAIPDINSGEFEAFKEKGDVLGVYFGHDHNNSFHGKVDSIDLGYCQGAGFNVYGPNLNRGVRMFEIDEHDVDNYKTYDVRYKDLIGKKLKKPLKNFMYTYAPTNVYDALYTLSKVGIIALIVAVIILLLKYLL